MNIYFDNIIYELQKAGGITTYWNMLLQNINGIKEIKGDRKSRYFDVHVKNEKSPFIFHSSYYRICNNKYAVNVTTVHDFTYEIFRNDLKSIIHKIQKKRAVMKSDGVICISENTKKDLLERYPCYKGKICVIYHGYDKNTFVDKNIEKKDKSVLFVGARGGYKRFDLTVELLSKIPELKLIIIGGGDLSENEINLLNYKLPNRYIKLGYINNLELCNLYNSSFALAYPSSYEGFGFPVIEAQACGCPVICQRKSSIPEVSGDDCIYVDENDIDLSIENIKKLFDNKVYNKIKNNGLKNVERFSWDICAKQTMDFYKALLKEKDK